MNEEAFGEELRITGEYNESEHEEYVNAILNSSLQYHLEILCMNDHIKGPDWIAFQPTKLHFFGILSTVKPIVFVNKHTRPLSVQIS